MIYLYYSPLRYPGGKGKLAPFMELMIDKLGLRGGTYIEPFAGGAGIALNLLFNNVVNTIVINDWDKAIASFWNAITKEPNRFIQMIYDTPVTVEEWKIQKEIYETHLTQCSFELGFATFYLNRTNRSGIIKGGIIGGYEQDSEWGIDARFNKDQLVKRIELIKTRRDDIKVYNKDVLSFISNYLPKYEDNAFVYFDPPYFNKGKELYKNFFDLEDHIMIERYIAENVNCKWMITYDDVKAITDIYYGYITRRFDLNYSAGKSRKASEIMIFQNLDICPTNKELEQRNININYRLTI